MLKYHLFENFVDFDKNLSYEKNINISSFYNNYFIYDSSCKPIFRKV